MNSVSRKLSGVLGRRKHKETFSLESRGNMRRNILSNESVHAQTNEQGYKRETAFSSSRKNTKGLNDANKLNIYIQEHYNRVNNNKYLAKREQSREASGGRESNFNSTLGTINNIYEDFKSSNCSFANNHELSQENLKKNLIQSKQELDCVGPQLHINSEDISINNNSIHIQETVINTCNTNLQLNKINSNKPRKEFVYSASSYSDDKDFATELDANETKDKNECDHIREEILMKDEENLCDTQEIKEFKPIQKVNSRIQQIGNALSFPSTNDIIRNDSCKSVPRRDVTK